MRRIDALYLAALALAGLAFAAMIALGVSRTPPWLSVLGALAALIAGWCDRNGQCVPRCALNVRRAAAFTPRRDPRGSGQLNSGVA